MITDFLIKEIDECMEHLDHLDALFLKEEDSDGRKNIQNIIFHYGGRLKQLLRCLDYTTQMIDERGITE